MKTNLLQLKTRLIVMVLLILSAGIFGQTLVNYPLDNNLNANPAPVAGLNPLLQYFSPPGVVPVTNTQHILGVLDFVKNGDFLELSFDVAANDDITLQVTAGTAVFLSSVTGNIQIWCKIGSDPEVKLNEKPLSASGFLDFTNISFSEVLPQATVPSRVKLRIVGNFSKSGLNIDYFGINNISLVKETTGISVKSNLASASFINHSDGASVARDTDFGSLLTNDIGLEKTYVIRNTGSRVLKLTNIDISPNNQGFTVTGPAQTTVAANGTTTFKVKFNPLNQGLSTAEVSINGNIVPNNPFRFEVKGNGKSCNLEPIPILIQNFETSGSNLNTDVISGTPGSTGNNSNSPSPVIPGALRLYPAAANLYAAGSATRSIFIRGSGTDTNNIAGTEEVILEFGPVDLIGQQEVSVNFEVAAFGTTNTNTSGVNGYDYVLLQVKKPDGSWSDEIKLNGSTGTRESDARSVKYGFGGALIPESNYDGVLNTVNNTATTKYGKFKLNIPASALTSDFTFRIKARAGRLITGLGTRTNPYLYYNNNLWLIDNVHVDAGNAKVKTWNGSGWTGADTNSPGSREKAVFAGNYNFTGTETADLSVCECEVNTGVSLTIPTGKFLSVRNKIINHDASGNNFVVESDANLLQEENAIVNADNITAKRIIKVGAARSQYNYLGTPVNFASGETFKTIYPGITFVLYHNEANNMFYNSSGVNVPGRGLAVKEPTGSGIATVTATYKGVPQNGNITLPITNKDSNPTITTYGYNLVGNPYASNIDLQLLYTINGGKTGSPQITSLNISSTFYFWDNNVNDIYVQQGNAYQGQAYAMYNALAGNTGTGTAAAGGSLNTGPGQKKPTNIVKVGQGFMTRSLKNNYDFLFNNSIRTSASTSGDFLGRGTAAVQDDRYWLEMISPTGITSTIAVVHYEGGHNLFGPEDSRSMGGSDALYTLVEGERIAIDGRSRFENTAVIPLGTQHFVSGSYTIGIDEAEGVFGNGQTIYLKDRQTGTVTNLSQGTYTFSANAGESTGRFEIIYRPETVLATDTKVKEGIVVYRDHDDFVIKSPKTMSIIQVYDVSGKLITILKPNSKQGILDSSGITNGVYVLKITTTDGEVTNKKIVR